MRMRSYRIVKAVNVLKNSEVQILKKRISLTINLFLFQVLEKALVYIQFFGKQVKGCNTYRPIFWYTDGDKRDYEKFYGVRHSHGYTEYGLKRTGCVGCPFNPRITEELENIKKYEPNLYTAAIHIFGQSYKYTRKYWEFVKMRKSQEKEHE